MYANAFQSRSTPRHLPAGLYQQVGIESQLSGASSHHLVVMLFDGWMEAVATARGAMRQRDMLVKGQALGRAVRIVEEGLRGGLNLTDGGTLARDLNELYDYLVRRLTMANLRNDEAMLDECQRLVQPLQEAWLAIGTQVARR